MLLQCDASQLEWRTALFLSQDRVGIKEVIEKQDAHSLNQKAFDLPSRLIAKIYLFRTIFRGSGYAFSIDNDFMHVSKNPKFWDAVNEKFYTKYSGLDQCHKRWAKLSMENKPIVGPFGREWLCPLKRDYRGELAIPWTTLTNYPVQGTGADIMVIARISFNNRLKRLREQGVLKGSVLLVLTIHDSIVVDVECEEDIPVLTELFHQVFADLPANIKKLFNVDWNVPMSCETKMGMNLKDMKPC